MLDQQRSIFLPISAATSKFKAEFFQKTFFLFLVCLPDSILAFHKHGVQGRSIKNGEITQEIVDKSKQYRLLGSDKWV